MSFIWARIVASAERSFAAAVMDEPVETLNLQRKMSRETVVLSCARSNAVSERNKSAVSYGSEPSGGCSQPLVVCRREKSSGGP